MRISDLYRNNIKNKKKEKKVYLVDKDKTSEEQSKIKTKNKFSVGNKALLPRNIISINNSNNNNNNNDKSIQIKISENSISKKYLNYFHLPDVIDVLSFYFFHSFLLFFYFYHNHHYHFGLKVHLILLHLYK